MRIQMRFAKSPCRSRAHWLFAIALAVIAIASCQKWVAALKSQPPVIDQDYQFKWEAPGPDWKLLNEAEASRVVPDAIAGATRTGAGAKAQYSVIIVERYPGELDSYAQLLTDGSALENKKVESRESLDFQKHKAVRTTMRGSVGDLKFIFQTLVFMSHGHGYQIISWGLDGQVDAVALQAAANSFTLLDGPVHGRQKQVPTQDARGPGWQLKGGTFRNAAWGFEIAPPDGARVVVGSELTRMNSSAEVGVVTSQPETYVIVLPERTTGANAQALAKKRMDANAQAAGAVAEEGGFTATVAGQTVAFQRYHSQSQPLVYYQGALIVDETLFVLLGWRTKTAREDSGPIAAVVSALRLLSPEARTTLAGELASLPDVQNVVGANYALRRGTYRDFAHGIAWKMPTGALRVQVAAAARAINESALAYVEDVGTGIGALLISESAEGMNGAAYHAAVTAGIFEGKKGQLPKARPAALTGVSAQTTIGNTTAAGVQIIKQVVSWVDGNTGYQFLSWGPRPLAKQAQARFDSLLQGLTVAPAKAVVAKNGDYADYRLGYSYTAPALAGGPWVRRDLTAKEIAGLGTTVEWKNERYTISIVGLCVMDTRQDEEVFLSKFRPDAHSLLSSAATAPDNLDGVPGKHLTIRNLSTANEHMIVVRRDGTFFGLFMTSLKGSLDDADVAAMKAGFHVLD